MKSLYTKFIVTTFGIMVLSFFLAFFISNIYYQQYLKPENDEKNTHIASEMAKFIEENPDLDINGYLNNIAEVGYQLYLVSETGEELFFGEDFREKSLDEDVVKQVMAGEEYHGMRDFPKQTLVTGFFANELSNTIGVPIKYQNEEYALFMRPDIKLLFDEIHILFGVLFALTVVLSIIFVLIGANFLIRPVIKLSQATKKVAEGDYHFYNLPTKRKDEIGRLSSSFTEMAHQIEENERMRKDFISNISHDIGSPLSNIKGYASLLSDNHLSLKDKEYYLSIIKDETSRISVMTNQLLTLSSLDHEAHILKKKKYNASEQISALLHSYEWQLDSKQIMLSYSLPHGIELYADPALINMVWDNLLSNAVKYTQSGGTIEINLKTKDDLCNVTVSNTTEYSDKPLTDKVFERFYRIDSTRGHHIGGTGLGLAIVKDIVEIHNGSIKLEHNDGVVTFTIILPLK